MSSSFSIYPQKITQCKADMDSVYRSWVSCNDDIISAMNNLGSYSGYVNIKRRLRDICNESTQSASAMLRYIQAIEQIMDKYEKTEERICGESGVDEAALEVLNPIEGYIVGDISQEESWWEQFKEGMAAAWDIMEQQITDMPEWLRLLFMAMPGMQGLGYLPYILENDYLRTAFWQALAGDFTDESNMLGVALSVGIGFIPIVGTIADVRDLVADIYNLVDDGPETSEWIDLVFTGIGLIPAVGDFVKHIKKFKHADEVGDVLKHADDFAGAVRHGDEAAGFFKRTKDFVSGATEQINNFKKSFDEKVIKRITEPLKEGLEAKLPDKFVDGWKNAMGITISEEDTLFDLVKELTCQEVQEITGIPTELDELLKKLVTKSDGESPRGAGAGEDNFADSFPGTKRTGTGFYAIPVY